MDEATTFQDRTINCQDCHQDFVFTAGEQEFYDRKGFKESPKRCKPCREVRKAKRPETQTAERPAERPVEETKEFWQQDNPQKRRGGRGRRR